MQNAFTSCSFHRKDGKAFIHAKFFLKGNSKAGNLHISLNVGWIFKILQLVTAFFPYMCLKIPLDMKMQCDFCSFEKSHHFWGPRKVQFKEKNRSSRKEMAIFSVNESWWKRRQFLQDFWNSSLKKRLTYPFFSLFWNFLCHTFRITTVSQIEIIL